MKKIVLALSLVMYINVNAQEGGHIYTDITTGAGATVEYLKSSTQFVSSNSNGIGTAKLSTSISGYHIPVGFHVLYGSSNWRVGLNVSYEYINMLRLKTNETYSDGRPNTQYSQTEDYAFHLIKIGALFEYDFWAKKISCLSAE